MFGVENSSQRLLTQKNSETVLSPQCDFQNGSLRNLIASLKLDPIPGSGTDTLSIPFNLYPQYSLKRRIISVYLIRLRRGLDEGLMS